MARHAWAEPLRRYRVSPPRKGIPPGFLAPQPVPDDAMLANQLAGPVAFYGVRQNRMKDVLDRSVPARFKFFW
jgi:hypothetical protein